jgi:hypothetical protein
MPPKGKRCRSKCPICGKDVANNQHGAFYKHNDTSGNKCSASGKTVKSGGKWLPNYGR